MKLWIILAAALAANAAGIRGRVEDITQAPVNNALITLINVRDHSSMRAHSHDLGDYRIEAVPPGSYALTIASAGFATHLEVFNVAPDNPIVDLGTTKLRLGSCNYPGTNCDYFGRGPIPQPKTVITDTCDALQHYKTYELVVIVGVLTERDGELILEGGCDAVLSVGGLRLRSGFVVDKNVRSDPIPNLKIPDFERKLAARAKQVHARVGPNVKLVALYGFLSFYESLKSVGCNSAQCAPDVPISPATLIGVRGYRELP